LGYLKFLHEDMALSSFGLLMTSFPSFGQTYFISLFGKEIRTDFGLSNGEFCSWYGIAIMCSGACLIWLGGLVDRFDLRSVSLTVILGLTLSL
jgi:hypothetical protein